MKNLTTKRRFSVATLLVALMMFAAGLFVSAPVQAATGGAGSATLVTTNEAGTEGHFDLDAKLTSGALLFVVTSSTKGAQNYTVPFDKVVPAPFGPDSGTITIQYLDPDLERWISLPGYTVPTVTPPTPTQAASISIDPLTGKATVTLTGNGSYHIILMGDLSRPADVVTGGSLTLPPFGPVTVATPIQVNVYGDGSGSGQRLADAVLNPPVPPVLEDNTATKQVTFCARVNPRAEAFIRTTLTVAEFLAGDHAADIVKPFDYIKQGVSVSHPGNLWDAAGQAAFNNNCSVIPSPSPTPTETETATTTPKPTATATSSPSHSSSAPAGGGTKTGGSSAGNTTSTTTNQSVKSNTSQTQTSPKVSRYPAALVDTAAMGGEVSVFAPGPFCFTATAFLVLVAGLLWRGEGRRRH